MKYATELLAQTSTHGTLAGMSGMNDHWSMDQIDLKPGMKVLAHTALDAWVPLTAATPSQQGRDFQVVWLCEDDAWDPDAKQPPANVIPWPIEEVRARP
ncbi:hypothetical protein [Tessaracoccus defluvii]